MKKIIATILIGSILALSVGAIVISYAAETAQAADTETKAIRASIPKPSTLPGPEESAQETAADQKAIFTDKILPNFTSGMIAFVGSMSFLFMVVAGVRFTVAYGDEEAIENAKKQMIYAAVGLIIAMLAYTIVVIISNLQFGLTT